MDDLQKSLNLLLKIISQIAVVAAIVPIAIGIINFKSLNKPLKVIFWFCIIRMSIIIFIQILYWGINYFKQTFKPILKALDITSMDFTSIFAQLNNFGLLGLYFSLVIPNKNVSIFIKRISVILFFGSILNYLFIEGYKNQSVYNSTSSNIFCFLLPCIHLWYIYREDIKVPLARNPYFWISFGLVIPNLLGLITSFIERKLNETDWTLFFKVEIIYSLVQIIGYLIVAIGFYYARYTKYMPKATT
jgi:hypothetical protein